MILKTHTSLNLTTGIHTPKIKEVSNLVSETMGMPVQPNKAIVGENAFAHSSGIHQDGLLKSPQTYQLIDPQDIGLPGYQLVLGKLSGKHALEDKLRQLGLKLGQEAMAEFTSYFKDHAAKKKFITDDDVMTIYNRFKNIKS